MVQRITRGWAQVPEVRTATDLARRAIAAGSDDAVALVLAGFALVMVGRDYGTGLDAVGRALERNPGSGFVNFMAGRALTFGGHPDQGLSHLERAMVLGPLDPSFYISLSVAATAELARGRPEQALELARRSVALNPNFDSTYLFLITGSVQLGRLDEAQAALATYLTLAPGKTLSALRNELPYRHDALLEMVLDGARQAGTAE